VTSTIHLANELQEEQIVLRNGKMRIGDINSTSNGQVPDSIFIRVKEVEDHVLQLVRYVSAKSLSGKEQRHWTEIYFMVNEDEF